LAEAPGPGAELLLFRLAGRGHACRREAVRGVVDIGTGQPPVPGLPSSSLGALQGGDRPVAVVSLRLALGLPDIGPVGRIVVVATRLGPVGFLVDEVLRVERLAPGTRVLPGRFGGSYVVGTVVAGDQSWLLVDWDAIRLPRRQAPPSGGGPDPSGWSPPQAGTHDAPGASRVAVSGAGAPRPRAGR
jgi:chemotaxis signal transduction protein